MKWLSTIKQADEGKLLLERMELDETGFPSRQAETRGACGDSLVLALGQEADLSLLDGGAGPEIEDGVVRVDERMMTGYPGIFAGGDMVPAERTVTVSIGHGGNRPRATSTHGCAPRSSCTSPSPASRPRRTQRLVLRRRAEPSRRNLDNDPPAVHVRRGHTGAWMDQRAVRGPPLPESCGNCFGCDNCYGVCPDNAVLKVDEARTATRSTSTTARAAGSASPSAQCGAIEMIPETV